MLLWKDRAKKHLRLMLLLPTLLPLSACGLSGGPLSGQVLEEGTHKPVPGAIVVVKWVGSVPAFADSQTVCVHVESTVTDQQGKYELPGWSKPSTVGPVVMNLGPVVTAYKPSYGWLEKPSQKEEIVYLAQFRGTTSERLDFLLRVLGNTSCGSQDESEKNLINVRKALYEEAQNLSRIKEDGRKVEAILYDLEILELGFETATKRHLQRGR